MFLPVVERELRVAARRRATYRLRFYSILLLLSVLCYQLLAHKLLTAPSGQLGSQLFQSLAITGFVFAILAGVIATADCVSREKRDGTLGLLFLTDLKGYDIIHGKLAASSIHAFYALIGTLPIVGIPLLLGGVTPAQFLRVCGALLTTIFFSLTVGITVSTHSRNERKAVVFTFLILATMTVAPPILEDALRGTMPRPTPDSWLLVCCSPFFTLAAAMSGPGAFWPPYAYLVSVLWLLAMSACLLALSSVRLPRMSGEEGGIRFATLRRLLQIRFPVPSGASRTSLDVNPFLWLAMRGEASRWRVWFFIVAVLGIWMAFWKELGTFIFDWQVVLWVVMLLHFSLSVWIAAEASRRFLEDRRDNTFELILSTPLSAGEIIRGQWLALWQQFGGPIAALVCVEIGLIVQFGHSFAYLGNQDAFRWLPVYLLFLVADSFALGWAGMWFGLKCRSRTQAMLGSLLLVVASRYLIAGALANLVFLRYRFTPNRFDHLQGWAFLPGVSIDAVVIIVFRHALLRNFRTMASAPFTTRK